MSPRELTEVLSRKLYEAAEMHRKCDYNEKNVIFLVFYENNEILYLILLHFSTHVV